MNGGPAIANLSMVMPCSTEESDCIGHVVDAMNDLS
jgi:hypothetical protein